MNQEIITNFSKSLAEEISEVKVYNVEDVSTLINARIKFCIRDLMRGYSAQAENEYMQLLEKQSKNRVGSPAYIQMGYKLAAAKKRKAAANRAANNMGRSDDYQKLKDFVNMRFGKSVLDQFYEEQEKVTRSNEEPIYSSKKP